MDFFTHQEAARRRSRRLVALFALAVAAIVVAVYVATTVLFFGVFGEGAGDLPLWDRDRLAGVAAAVLAIVAAGSLWKIAQLGRGGGAALAERLGGRRLDPAAADPDERRLLNVVEEMALASGVPVPAVFLLERELGINAFAAGSTPSDAVLGVTRGAVRRLRRDELQGVVAHEFSHLLNGDMRLNLRLVGLLHGILVIAMVGEILLRSGRSAGSSRRKGKGGGSIALFGLALYLIGWIGIYFGRLIKAGVSRQREFLADASAVQFTRDPQGIGGALRKIGGLSTGSRLVATRAEEASHFYFADGLPGRWFESLSTHPPLVERIRRIDPAFDGSFPALPPLEEERPAEAPAAAPAALQRAVGLAAAAVAAGSLTATAGEVRREQLDRVVALLDALPAGAREAVREPLGARATVAALLLAEDPAVRAMQLERVDREGSEALGAWVRQLAAAQPRAAGELRLPLLDLALPALRRLTPAEHAAFRSLVADLATADRRLSLFELALERALARHLDPHFGARRPERIEIYTLRGVPEECARLLSAIAHAAQRDEAAALAAFAAGAAALAARGVEVRPAGAEERTPEAVGAALDRLGRVALPARRALLEAAVVVAANDGRLEPDETELLRAIADALGVPVPPPGAQLSA